MRYQKSYTETKYFLFISIFVFYQDRSYGRDAESRSIKILLFLKAKLDLKEDEL